jgi:hypothetical protein
MKLSRRVLRARASASPADLTSRQRFSLASLRPLLLAVPVLIGTACGDSATGPVVPEVPTTTTPNPNTTTPTASLMTVQAGDQQTGSPGQAVASAPTVRVTDAAGKPVPGVSVSFLVLSGGGSVANPNATTDASGMASAGAWKLGPSTGANELEARAAGVPSTRFIATAVSAYRIEVRFIGTFSAAQRSIVETAIGRWQSAILSELPDVPMNIPAGQCFPEQPAVNETIDDLLIYVTASNIDGVNGTLAQAGPCYVRNTGGTPILGSMKIDTSDMTNALNSGLLDDVLLHEMGHVMGIGTLWESTLLIGAGGADPNFIGATALAEFRKLRATATGVPVENQGGAGTRDGHWRESIFGNELMTGYINANNNPMSRVTLGSLADLGYQVDYTAASAYSLPLPGLRAPSTDFQIEGAEELITPIRRVGP